MRLTLFLGIAGLLSVGSAATSRANKRQTSKAVGRALSSVPPASRLHSRQSSTNDTDSENSDDGGYDDPYYIQPYKINDQYNLTVFATSDDELPDDPILNATYSDALKYALSRNGPTLTNATFEDPFVWNGQLIEDERVVGFIKSRPGSANLTWSLAATTLTGLQSFFNEAEASNSSDLILGQTFLVTDTKRNVIVAEGSFGSTPQIPVDANSTKAPGLITFPLIEDLEVRYNTTDPIGGSFDGQFMTEQLGDCSDASALYEGASTVDGSNMTIGTNASNPWTWVTHSFYNTSSSSFNLVISQLYSVDQFSVADVLQGITENVTNAGYFVGGSFVVVNTTNVTSAHNKPVMYGVISNKALTNASFAGSWAAQNVTGSGSGPVSPSTQSSSAPIAVSSHVSTSSSSSAPIAVSSHVSTSSSSSSSSSSSPAKTPASATSATKTSSGPLKT